MLRGGQGRGAERCCKGAGVMLAVQRVEDMEVDVVWEGQLPGCQ